MLDSLAPSMAIIAASSTAAEPAAAEATDDEFAPAAAAVAAAAEAAESEPYSRMMSVDTYLAVPRYQSKQSQLPPLLVGTLLLHAREAHNPRDPNAIRLFLPTPSDESPGSTASESVAVARTSASEDGQSAENGSTSQPPVSSSVGHLPAVLARRLSPLLVGGLVTLQVRVAPPPLAKEEPPSEEGEAASAATPTPTQTTTTSEYRRVDLVVEILPARIGDAEREPYSTAEISLWRDLELFVSTSAAATRVSYDERVVRNFAIIARAAMAQFRHILSEREVADVHHFLQLSFDSQRFFIRLFNRIRSHRWFHLSTLRMPFDMQDAIEQLGATAAADEKRTNNSESVPLLQRSYTTPATLKENLATPSLTTSPDPHAPGASCAFVFRASSLPIDAWSRALPHILRECTVQTIKDLIASLGLKNKLMNASSQSAVLKESLIRHLSTQRTLFAKSMLACAKTKKVVIDTCGDFLLLSPSFHAVCRRLHALFFLQEDPSQSSPMKLEEIGLFRWFKSPSLTAAFEQAQKAHTQQEHTTSTNLQTGLKTVTDHPSPIDCKESTPQWCLFPSRACFLAYDVGVQFLLRMQSVCESVLATGEGRKQAADNTEEALQLLAEAKRRLDLELESTNSTADLDATYDASTSTPSNSTPTPPPPVPFRRAKSMPQTVTPSTKQAISTDNFVGKISFDNFSPSYLPGFSSAPLPPDEVVHPFAMSYRAVSAYVTCVHYGLKVLEKLKRHAEANSLLLALLSQSYGAHRRGTWWNRLALNLETHTRQHALAYRMARLGLADPHVRCGEMVELCGRVKRLWKHRGPEETAAECPVAALPDFSRPRAVGTDAKARRNTKADGDDDMWCEDEYTSVVSDGVILSVIKAAPTNRNIGVHSRFYDDDNHACRVESLALTYYARNEFGAYVGRHDEGAIFHALFALLMFEVIFEDLPHVFQTHFQDAPLDLCCDSFYTSRLSTISSTLAAIRSCDDLSALLSAAWSAHHGIRVRGLNWRGDLTLPHLQEVAECMGGDAIAGVCEMLARDYGGWSGGLPDLCLWRPGVKHAKRTVVEESCDPQPFLAADAQRRPEMAEESAMKPVAIQDSPVDDVSSTPISALASATTFPSPPPAADEISLWTSVRPAPANPAPAVICISSDDEDTLTARSPPSVHATRTPPPSSTMKRSGAKARIKPNATDRKRAKRNDDATQESRTQGQPARRAFDTPRALMASDATTNNCTIDVDDDDDVVCTGTTLASRPSLLPPLPAPIPATPPPSSPRLLSSPHDHPPMKLVEVKGPNDRLSSQQTAWLHRLSRFLAVEVCYVITPEQAGR